MNINVEFTIIDCSFFKKQASNIHIYIMIISFIVRDLKIIKYKINEYALIFIYIYDKDDVIGERIRACFIKEVHIIDDLKTNIFIDNDIDNFENIIIFISDRIAHIDNCNVTIFLKVKIIEIVVAKSVHVRKIILISSRTKISVEIHYLIVFYRKYLFELKKIFNLIAYAHLINAFIKVILLRNEFDIFIQISRNHRLERIIKVNYFNVFHIATDNDNKNKICNLIVRRLRSSK